MNNKRPNLSIYPFVYINLSKYSFCLLFFLLVLFLCSPCFRLFTLFTCLTIISRSLLLCACNYISVYPILLFIHHLIHRSCAYLYACLPTYLFFFYTSTYRYLLFFCIFFPFVFHVFAPPPLSLGYFWCVNCNQGNHFCLASIASLRAKSPVRTWKLIVFVHMESALNLGCDFPECLFD